MPKNSKGIKLETDFQIPKEKESLKIIAPVKIQKIYILALNKNFQWAHRLRSVGERLSLFGEKKSDERLSFNA